MLNKNRPKGARAAPPQKGETMNLPLMLNVRLNSEFQPQKNQMKHMNTKYAALLASLIALASLSASAGTTTVYSNTDFSSMASANGTYVPGSPGYEALSFSPSTGANTVDAVVGVRGPLGTLSQLSMSFTYTNYVSASGAPFAAFGVSVDGVWGSGSAYEYDIISDQGNVLTDSTLVHVWDYTLNGGAGGDVAGLSGVTLATVLGTPDTYNHVDYGALEVMRGYAYIGDEGASSGSVDIESITIGNSAPDGAPTLLLLGIGLAGLGVLSLRRNRPQAVK